MWTLFESNWDVYIQRSVWLTLSEGRGESYPRWFSWLPLSEWWGGKLSWLAHYFGQTEMFTSTILSEILGGGQDKPPWTACPPTPCQCITQLNLWNEHLSLIEIMFISLSTKYSSSRWCNKIWGLSILSEILGGGRGKINHPGQLAPHPLSIHNPTELLKWASQIDWNNVYIYPFQLNIPVADGVIKFGDYQFSLKFWAGGKINRPGPLAPHPLSIRNPTEPLKWASQIDWNKIYIPFN